MVNRCSPQSAAANISTGASSQSAFDAETPCVGATCPPLETLVPVPQCDRASAPPHVLAARARQAVIINAADRYWRALAHIPRSTARRERELSARLPELRRFIEWRDDARTAAWWNFCVEIGIPPQLFVSDILTLWPQK